MIKIVCKHCGSDNVMRDAWATWNVELQEWELLNVYDNAYCNECDGETSLKEVEI